LPEAVELIEELQPRRAYLTHLSHELGHAEGSALLPAGIEIAYDGLVVRSGERSEPADSGIGD
jgi:phosphoribosyl 1,2-cyclic phosphate phosphodiesterase